MASIDVYTDQAIHMFRKTKRLRQRADQTEQDLVKALRYLNPEQFKAFVVETEKINQGV